MLLEIISVCAYLAVLKCLLNLPHHSGEADNHICNVTVFT